MSSIGTQLFFCAEAHGSYQGNARDWPGQLVHDARTTGYCPCPCLLYQGLSRSGSRANP
jgi:hypothetical protein